MVGTNLPDAYGATEVGSTCTISSEEWLTHPGSVESRRPAVRRASSSTNMAKSCRPNTEGRLYFEDETGRGIVYRNDPKKTAEAHLRPGVFTLGEMGYVDDDGYVFLTDRFSDMIVSGGVNIYPAESENVLMEHPLVADVAVIGVPNQEMGEEVRALVVPTDLADPPDEADLIGWCRQHLAGYKCPRSVEFVESVGRTTMGKVNKRELRRPFWDATGALD